MGRDYQQSFYPPNDRGYRLEFKNPPPQRFFLTHLPRDQERRQAIVNLIVMWETEGVISPFLEDQKFRGFYSCISLVGKATSGFWMVINFKCPEQIHSLQTIPDGKHLFCKESVITRSVHGNPGSSGRLPSCTNLPESSKVPQICSSHGERSTSLAVQSPPFWFLGSTNDFHENPGQNRGLFSNTEGIDRSIFRLFFWSLPERKRALFRICN